MPWPSYSNAFAGEPGPDPGNALTVFAHRGGSWQPVGEFAHRQGAWRPTRIYPLPADLGDPDPPPDPDTTVINITDLLLSGETLVASNNTIHMQRCLDRLLRRTNAAAAVTTDHVTVDFEDTFWRCEDPLSVPRDAMITSEGIKHPCQNWPGGMTWRNGGIYATTDDGTLAVGGNGKNRNRFQLELQQAIQRPTATDQWLTFESWWAKGPHSYAKPNYDVDREAQHAVWLRGQQWVRFVDTEFEETWGDALFTQVYDVPNLGRDGDVYPGMIEVLGGRWQRLGRMFITMNQVRPPDGVITPGYWHNPGDGTGPVDNGISSIPAGNDAPSVSGTQYGLWWHGNAAHPFQGIDASRSCVDIENMLSFAHCTDVRIGADAESTPAVDQLNFKLSGDGNNLISCGNGFGLVHRFKISRLWRNGANWTPFSVRFVCSPSPVGTSTTTISAASNGQPITSSTYNLTSVGGAWTTKGYATITVAGTERIIQYTGRGNTTLTGCTVFRGATTGTLTTGQTISEKWANPDRPKYVSGDIEISDNLFTGYVGMEIECRRIDVLTIVRNTAQYRKGNGLPVPFSEVIDCPNFDKGGSGTFGSNNFTSV